MDAVAILAILFTVAATICIYIFVMPRSKDGGLPPFLQFLHNLFHFKRLLLEQVVKFLYVLTTVACVIFGFFFMFSGVRDSFLMGLLTMLLGPIAVRIVFEGMIMMILLVQNVLDINRKLKWPEKPAENNGKPTYYAPVAPQWQQPIPQNNEPNDQQ